MQPDYGKLEPEIICFVDRKCLSTWAIHESRILFHDLTYIYSGRATYVINGVPYHVKDGDLIYIPAGCTRGAYAEGKDPMCCFTFNFQCSLHSGEQVNLPLPFTSKIPKTDCDLMKLYNEFNNIWLDKRDFYMLKARAIFMMIIYKYILYGIHGTEQSFSDKRIKKIKEFILKNYPEKIKMSTLAKIADLNPIYLGGYFKKSTGFSVKHYINTVRINKARDLLSAGGYTVSEAALECGFKDIFYFSKIFKEMTGVPPSAFLK
ncbi:MAG: AraC family transcriptional regulator [Clostridiales bacterium]|nr:AraC family transcriptional regulator [Clostridiales bacterium]